MAVEVIEGIEASHASHIHHNTDAQQTLYLSISLSLYLSSLYVPDPTQRPPSSPQRPHQRVLQTSQRLWQREGQPASLPGGGGRRRKEEEDEREEDEEEKDEEEAQRHVYWGQSLSTFQLTGTLK